ncbi:hypothetical protein CHS0354_002172 [Potamilus streckersoni]|uniref:G-protein coupled receptors family 1 profile domain-containing protein n=1 Tax=Potamilus streckersoni TaxID=2493646 RepID=A0AAE0RS71_9BIVA|nr:hypothetical protein CHS0354_002172 [Potamilus streckersoni]
MSSIENVTSWMVDSYGRNVTIFNFQLQMPDYIVAIYMLYLSMCMAIGVPGNSIVVVVFLKNKPKSNADWYIFCTAAFDLVCLLVTAPMYIVIQTKLWDVVDRGLEVVTNWQANKAKYHKLEKDSEVQPSFSTPMSNGMHGGDIQDDSNINKPHHLPNTK